MEFESYQKYRWFLTKSKKIVVGGRSAVQNEELLKSLKKQNSDLIVMHTSSPGSPFAVIISSIKEVSESDIEQTAVFTACFSRNWRDGKENSTVDIFKLSQLYKGKKMKTGTWGVKGDIKHKKVKIELVLTTQKDILRAVPPTTPDKKSILLRLSPGKIDKNSIVPKMALELHDTFNQEAILSALPPGGIKIKRK